MTFLLQVLAAIGIFVLCCVAYFATVRYMCRHLRRSAPEVERLAEGLRENLLTDLVTKDFSHNKEDTSLRAEIRRRGLPAALMLAVVGLLALINKLGLPIVWTSIAATLVLGVPLLVLLSYLHQRPRIKRALRERMIQHGVLICPHCAADLQETTPGNCPACRKAIDWDHFLNAPPPEDNTTTTPPTPSSPPDKIRAILGLLMVVGLLALPAVALAVLISMLNEARSLNLDAWHEATLPADTYIEIEKADTLGFFLRSDSSANVADTQSSSPDAGTIRIHLLDAETGEPLTLRVPAAARDDKRWDTQGTEVRIVRVADIPAAGTYRLIVDGNPADGPLFWRLKQRAEKLMMLAKMALPLVLLFAIVGAFKLRDRLRKRRDKAEQASAASA